MPLFALLDKSEFEEVIASVSEPIFEPRQGRKRIARGGTATCLGGAAQQRRRELRAVVGACFLCLRYFETMRYFAPRIMPPLPGFAFVFVADSRGSRP